MIGAATVMASATATAEGLTLAERGKAANYSIVLPLKASVSQRYAAKELQGFTEQMIGVKLPIVTDDGTLPERAILLGNTRHTQQVLGEPIKIEELGDDGFRLVTRSPHLLVIGGTLRGTLYGVYELLEKHGGCRWYSSWHSVIPKHQAWKIAGIDDVQTPAFAMREPFWFDFFDGDLAARNKANGNAMRLTDRHGGKVRFGAGLFVHTFNTLCPPDEFFESHPEYFSEINGKRLKEHSQLCLTNPEVLKIVTERLLERMRKDPTARLFSVSQNDWANPCTCAKCKAIDDREESHAGTMITFVNQVAEAVEKEFPEAWIETLAYQYTRKPPKTLKPRHNVVPRLCTIECDFSKSLDQSQYKENRLFVDEIRAWSAMTDKLYVWDYTTNFHAYTGPFPNVLALQGNIRLFRDNGVVGLFEQGAYGGRHADFAELKAWLLAKWLWNPDLPAEPLIDDFFNGYYGAAAPLVRKYFDELHAFYQQPETWLRIFDDVRKSPVSDEFLSQSTDLWRQAAEKVKDDPVLSYNVRMGMIPVLHTRVERMPDHQEIKVWLTRNPGRYDLPAERRELISELLGLLQEAGNVKVSEHAARGDAVLARWKALVERKPSAVDPKRAQVTIEDTELILGRPGEWGETVADPLAEDGSAIKLFNTHYEWCTTLPFKQVAFDEGVKHRLRVRLRVEREPGARGQAFWAGVYDSKNKTSHGNLARQVEQLEDGYAWYEVADWVPERDHFFWIGPGKFDKKAGESSAIRALYVDKLELIRVGE